VKLKEKFTLPKGTYYIGDPCYIFNTKFYDEVLIKHGVEADRNGRNCFLIQTNSENCFTQLSVVSFTQYGDGNFPSNSGLYFPVDSGQIACIDSCSVGLKTEDELFNCSGNNLIHKISFHKDFNCVRYHNGVLKFGKIKIHT